MHEVLAEDSAPDFPQGDEYNVIPVDLRCVSLPVQIRGCGRPRGATNGVIGLVKVKKTLAEETDEKKAKKRGRPELT